MKENGATKSTNLQSRTVQHHEITDRTLSTKLVVEADDLEVEKTLFDWKKFMVLVILLLFIFPLLPLGLAAVFGGLFPICERDTTYIDGFLYVVSNLLGMSNPLTDYSPSSTTGGVILDMYVAVASLVCFGILLNIVDLFDLPIAMNRFIERFVTNAFLIPLIALCIIIPLVNGVLCAAFGALLAFAEGWSVKEGILYVLSNTLGLGTPFTEKSPSTLAGCILDVIISSMALGYIAIFADYVTILNPSSAVRRVIRSRFDAAGVIDLQTSSAEHPLASPSNVNGHGAPTTGCAERSKVGPNTDFNGESEEEKEV